MRISPINPQFCKFSIKKSEILTFGLQKRLHFAVLVKGLFSPAKNLFLSASLPDQINREPFGPTGQTGAPVNFFFSRPHRAIWGSALSGNLPPNSTLKIEYNHAASCAAAFGIL